MKYYKIRYSRFGGGEWRSHVTGKPITRKEDAIAEAERLAGSFQEVWLTRQGGKDGATFVGYWLAGKAKDPFAGVGR